MSLDVVDDYEYAEELVGNAATIVGRAIDALTDPRGTDFFIALGELTRLQAELGDYCRPTCGWRETGECAQPPIEIDRAAYYADTGDLAGADESCCGCPCRHGEA